MAEASDLSMQQFANERVRVFAESLRAVFNSAEDHRSAIDDIYERAVGDDRWSDARTDGPPHLLQSGDAASPDDMLNFNSALAMLLKLRDGTFASQGEANSFAALWAVLLRACVRAV